MVNIPTKNGHYDLNYMIDEIQKYKPHEMSKWGPKMWGMLNYVASFIPCGNCAKHAEDMLVFEHDLVNIHKGKPIYDINLFKRYLQDIIDAIKQYDMNTGKPLPSCSGDSCEHNSKVEMR